MTIGSAPSSAASTHHSVNPRRLQGALLVLVSAVAFGTIPILVKLGLRAGVSVQQMLTLRFVVAGAGMAILAVAAESAFGKLSRHDARLAVLAGALYAAQALALFIALERVPAAFASLVLYTYPIIVAVLGAIFLGRRASRRQLAGLVLSIFGVGLLIGGISVSASWSLTAAFFVPILYAAYLLIVERTSSQVPALTLSAIVLLTGGLIMLVAAAVRQTSWPPARVDGWAVIAALTLVPIVGIPCLIAGMARLGATSASVISTAEPAVTVALATLVLSEVATIGQVVGGALVLTSAVLVELDPHSGPASSPQATPGAPS